MSMLEQRIQQQFFESADLKYQSAELLSRDIASATQALLGALTAGGKVLICGSGAGQTLASHLHALLVGRFERERPPLAAIDISAHGPLSTLLNASDANVQQVRALAQPGDVLLLIDSGGNDTALAAAASAAREQETSLVVLSSTSAVAWRERLSDTDVLVAVPHERAARVLELHMLVLHGICDALDLQLLGEQEP
jgi:D-sedoheptulose 7-phosphate isomerase